MHLGGKRVELVGSIQRDPGNPSSLLELNKFEVAVNIHGCAPLVIGLGSIQAARFLRAEQAG